jgi:hypothetical protein
MKRVGQWAARLVTALGIAAVAVVPLWVWAVPRFVYRAVVGQFAAFGLPQLTFHVCALSPSHLAITDPAAGQDDRLRIGAVGVEGGIAQLLFNRIDTLEIVGFWVEIRRRDGAWV